MKILLLAIISVFSISCSFDRSEFICDEQGATDDQGRTCDKGVWIALDAGQTGTDTGPDTKDETCNDDDLNQDESAIDCGGATCDECGDGMGCSAGTDCTSGVCLNNICIPHTCGDGIINGNETCDGDGAGTGGSTPTCDIDCSAVECGDGLANTEAGEICDGDGAGTGGETANCNTDCSAPECGDAVVNTLAGESCDDGNTANDDGCDSSCKIEDTHNCNDTSLGETGDTSCASGICNTASGNPGICAAANTCGNNILDSGEGCDDGDTVNSDGCDSSCKIEDNHACNETSPGATGGASCASGICNTAGGNPGICAAANTCGNNILDSGEGCDDGGNVDNDGCNSSCKIETGNACNTAPPGATGNASCASQDCHMDGKCT